MHNHFVKLLLLRGPGKGARADVGDVPGFEADLGRWRTRPEPEIPLLRVHEQGVCDEALQVLPGRLPLSPALVGE